MKLGTCARRCKGRRAGSFRRCVKSCMKGGRRARRVSRRRRRRR